MMAASMGSSKLKLVGAVVVVMLVLLPMLHQAEAACAYNTQPLHHWTFEVYAQPGCVKSSGYLQYWGTNECRCYNIGSPLNNNVRSFVFTSYTHRIYIYEGPNCSRARIGESNGNWIKNPTSATGRTMSSFNVCKN